MVGEGLKDDDDCDDNGDCLNVMEDGGEDVGMDSTASFERTDDEGDGMERGGDGIDTGDGMKLVSGEAIVNGGAIRLASANEGRGLTIGHSTMAGLSTSILLCG